MRGLFIGRFQPFHKGHLKIVEAAIDEVDELVIGIGSAERSFSREDPFTAGERMEMIQKVLQARSLDGKITLVPIRDVNRYSIWVSHVASLVPGIDIVFSNNPLTIRLFKEAGYEVHSTELVDRKNYSGSTIRELISSGNDWKEVVPVEIYNFMIEKKLDDRIIELSSSGDIE